MAGFQHSKASVIKIDIVNGSSAHLLTLGDISQYVTGVEGLPGERELADISSLAESGHKFFGAGMTNAQVTLSMIWNSDVSSSGSGGPNALEDWFGNKDASFGSTTTRSFEFSPDTTAGGKRKFTGESYISTLIETARLGEMVLMDCVLQVDGAVTIGAH